MMHLLHDVFTSLPCYLEQNTVIYSNSQGLGRVRHACKERPAWQIGEKKQAKEETLGLKGRKRTLLH